MTRRSFATAGLLLGIGATAATYRSYLGSRWQGLVRRVRFLQPSVEEKGRLLEAAFPHLRFAKNTGARFVKIHLTETKGNTAFPLDELVLKQFLLSTNFVQKKGDPQESFSFVGYYMPFRSPCYNPFMILNRKTRAAAMCVPSSMDFTG